MSRRTKENLTDSDRLTEETAFQALAHSGNRAAQAAGAWRINVQHRLTRNMSANALNQLVSIGTQLAAVPIFLQHWSIAQYGTWLMLTTIPTYLGMADAGLVASTANIMSMRMTVQDKEGARAALHRCIKSLTTVAIAITLLSALAAYSAYQFSGFAGDKATAALLLSLSVLISFAQGIVEAVFRAIGSYSTGILFTTANRASECLGWLTGLACIASFTGVAALGLIAKLACLMVSYIISQRRDPYFRWGTRYASSAAPRGNSLGFLAFPAANALTLQASSLIVGIAFGPAALALFNTYRTLSRVMVQGVSVLSHAVWPHFTELFALGEISALRLAYRRSLMMSLGLAAVASFGMLLAGPTILRIWTNGHIAENYTLLVGLVFCALASSIGQLPRVLVSAINQHGILAICTVIQASALVILMIATAGISGVETQAFLWLFLEAALAGISLWLASRCLKRSSAGVAA